MEDAGLRRSHLSPITVPLLRGRATVNLEKGALQQSVPFQMKCESDKAFLLTLGAFTPAPACFYSRISRVPMVHHILVPLTGCSNGPRASSPKSALGQGSHSKDLEASPGTVFI